MPKICEKLNQHMVTTALRTVPGVGVVVGFSLGLVAGSRAMRLQAWWPRVLPARPCLADWPGAGLSVSGWEGVAGPSLKRCHTWTPGRVGADGEVRRRAGYRSGQGRDREGDWRAGAWYLEHRTLLPGPLAAWRRRRRPRRARRRRSLRNRPGRRGGAASEAEADSRNQQGWEGQEGGRRRRNV